MARAATAPHGPGDEGPRYPGTCRALKASEVAERERSGRRPSLRLRVDPGEVVFEDAVAGPVRQDVAEAVGDFIVQRADGLFAYQLAVAVDDLGMGIVEIVRGDDLLGSTPRQLLLRALLGGPAAPPLSFAHVPLVLGPDGRRLSKRHGSIAVRALREAGVAPGRLLGWLAATLGLGPPGAEARLEQLLETFSFARIPREPTVWEGPSALAG